MKYETTLGNINTEKSSNRNFDILSRSLELITNNGSVNALSVTIALEIAEIIVKEKAFGFHIHGYCKGKGIEWEKDFRDRLECSYPENSAGINWIKWIKNDITKLSLLWYNLI